MRVDQIGRHTNEDERARIGKIVRHPLQTIGMLCHRVGIVKNDFLLEVDYRPAWRTRHKPQQRPLQTREIV